MPAYKQFRRIRLYFLPYSLVVLAGITAYVRNPHVDPFAVKAVIKREFHTGFVTVNIAIYCPERFFFLQGIGNGKVTYITCMPYFICLAGILKDSIINMAVGIAEKEDFQLL